MVTDGVTTAGETGREDVVTWVRWLNSIDDEEGFRPPFDDDDEDDGRSSEDDDEDEDEYSYELLLIVFALLFLFDFGEDDEVFCPNRLRSS